MCEMPQVNMLPQFTGLRATRVEGRPHKVWVAFTLPSRDVLDGGEFDLVSYLIAAAEARRQPDPDGYMHLWYFSQF